MTNHYGYMFPKPIEVKEAKLISVKPYKDKDRWYLRLVFDYELMNGDKYKLEIPKMELPFSQLMIPDFIDRFSSYDPLADEAYIRVRGCEVDGFTCIPLRYGTLTEISGNKEKCGYATKMVSKQMTIEEIEKELGYKVNIVDKH